MAKSDIRYAVSAWTGEFRDGEIEAAYRAHIAPGMARHLRIALLVWAGLLVVFGALDYLALGASAGFYHLMGGRLLSAATLVILAWRVLRNHRLATDAYAVTAVEIFGFVLFYIIYFARPDITVWNIGVTLILLVGIYIFIPTRVKLANLAAAFGIAGTLYTLYHKGTAPGAMIGLLFILSLPTVVGYVAALRLQIVQRDQFALLNDMVEINHALEDEIRRREELEVELKRQATTDPLTGLFNRRQYEMLFDRERERARRLGTKLSLCVLDLDHFKQVNDKYGHDLGDQVLKHIAALFTQRLRQSDIVGRFGGEEFIMLLPDTDLTQAEVVVNRMREHLLQSPLVTPEVTILLSATFGVTEVGAADKSIEDVIRRADKALYDGKQAGRNRVITAA
jgi:diguanylate cyclase